MKKVLKWLGRNWYLLYGSILFCPVLIALFEYCCVEKMEQALSPFDFGMLVGVACTFPFFFVGIFKLILWLKEWCE